MCKQSLKPVHHNIVSSAFLWASKRFQYEFHRFTCTALPWGVDEVEHVRQPVQGRVIHACRVEFDGDPPLALDIHAVQQLGPDT